MNRKNLFNLTLITLLLTSFTFTTVQAKVNVERLKGNNRYETMKTISQSHSSEKVDTVIIASGENFPDALSAGILSKKFNAPIVLVSNSNIKEAFGYIENHLNNNGQAIILGGEGSVSSNIENTLNIKGYRVVRLGGNDRFNTNSKIVEFAKVEKGTPIILANGKAFPDALSVSSISGIKSYPILLTSKDSLNETTVEQIKNISPSKVYIIGGTGAISDEVKNNLLSITGLTSDSVIRIYGNNRYETSLNIAKAFELTTDTVVLANGENFPDALSGSALAIKLNSPIVLTDGKNITKQKEFIDTKNFSKSVLLGGYGAISKEIEDYLTTDILTPNNPATGTPGANNKYLSIDEGWVVPTLKSTSVDDLAKDAKTLINELEFTQNGNTSAYFDPANKKAKYAVTTVGPYNSTHFSSIIFKGYYSPVYQKYMSKGEHINPQVLKFYFPTKWKEIHNALMADKNLNGTRATWDGRDVYVEVVNNTIMIQFSKVGGKLNR